MKDKTRELLLSGVVALTLAITVAVVGVILFGKEGWLYDHVGTICLAMGAAFAVVVLGIVVMWNHNKPTTKAAAVAAIIAVATTTAQAGIFTPAGGDSANTGKSWSWLFRGWDFGWGFWRDGLDSWQSGHPVVNIDPAPPSNSDASGK